jgi:ribosomal protein S18 acetylase RimI-like enzyme
VLPIVEIRVAKLADVPEILELWNELIQCSRDNFCYRGPLFQYRENASDIVAKSIRKNIRSRNDLVLVATNDGLIVGFAISGIAKLPKYLLHDREVHIGDIFVKEDFRGKGIGSSLIKETEKWANEKGIFSLGLMCSVHNENARKAYEKNGFFAHHIKMSKKID